MAHDQGDSDELQLTHEVTARMLGSRRSTATLPAGVLKNQSQPLRLKTRTVIALLIASSVLGNFTLSRGLHEVAAALLTGAGAGAAVGGLATTGADVRPSRNQVCVWLHGITLLFFSA